MAEPERRAYSVSQTAAASLASEPKGLDLVWDMMLKRAAEDLAKDGRRVVSDTLAEQYTHYLRFVQTDDGYREVSCVRENAQVVIMRLTVISEPIPACSCTVPPGADPEHAVMMKRDCPQHGTAALPGLQRKS